MKFYDLLFISAVFLGPQIANAQNDSGSTCDASNIEESMEVVYSGEEPLSLYTWSNNQEAETTSAYRWGNYSPDRVVLTAYIPDEIREKAEAMNETPSVQIEHGDKFTITEFSPQGTIWLSSRSGVRFSVKCSDEYDQNEWSVPLSVTDVVSRTVRRSEIEEVACTKEAIEVHFQFTPACTGLKVPLN